MAYYNKLKDKLRPESGLPEGYEWDSMKQGIFDKMPQKKKRRNGILFFLLGLVCIGGITWYILAQHENKSLGKDTNKAIVHSTNKTKESKLANNTNEDKTNIEEIQGNTESNITNTHVASEEVKAKNPAATITTQQKNQKRSKKPIFPALHESQTVKKEAVVMTESVQSSDNTVAKKENTIQQNTVAENLFSPGNQESETRTVFEIQTILSLPYLSFMVQSTEGLHLDQPELTSFKKPVNKPFIVAKDICFGGGTVLWNRHQKNDQIFSSADHHATIIEKELPGLSVFVRADLFTSRNIFVSTGLDYQRWYSDYFYTGTKTEIKNVNVVTMVEYNLISGSQTEIIENVSRSVSENRKFRNRNEMTMLHLPLLLGYQYRLSRWFVKGSFGPVFTLHTGGSGKKLIGNDVIEYKGISPDIKSRFAVSAGAQLNIGYQLTPSWLVCAQASWFKSLQNTSNQESSVNKPSMVGLGLAVGYGF
jgi:copper chaperone CopZ